MSTTKKSAKLLKGKSLKRPFITTFAVALPAVAAFASFPACSSTQPDATQNGGVAPLPGADGPCVNGTKRSCHVVTGQQKGFVDCYEGSQTCEGTAWGACGGSGSISSHYMPNITFSSRASGGLHTLAANPPPLPADSGVDGGTSCDLDPCNPYCWSFDASPDAGPVSPPIPVPNVPINGVAVCSPTPDPTGMACMTNADCWQDFHCQAGGCAWNIPSGYTDPACAGFDLTINAWCPSTGGGNPPPATFTVCNRGTQPLKQIAGATTKIQEWESNGNPAKLASECASPYYHPSGPSDASLVLAADLAPGACTTMDGAGINGNRHTFVYATRALTTSTTSGNGVTPIAYTTTVAHGLKNGDVVTVTGITGNTNANVTTKAITVTGATTFTVAGVTGNGAYGGTGAIDASLTECNAAGNGGCFNNQSSPKNNGSCGTCGPGGGAPVTITTPYHAICPTPDTHPEWTFLLYNVTSGGGDVKFEIRTAPDVDGGLPGTYTSWVTAADPPVAAEPWIRTLANPVGLARPVPPALVPVGGILGGPPATRNEWVQLKITVSNGGSPPPPALNSWALEYSCVPLE